MGTSDPQPAMFYHINSEQLVTADHPMRKIRPLIYTHVLNRGGSGVASPADRL